MEAPNSTSVLLDLLYQTNEVQKSEAGAMLVHCSAGVGRSGTFIGLYKDTTLVVVIGLLDPLGIARGSLADTKWNGLTIEVYIFVALFFFVSCLAMSRYSLWLEKKLNTDHK